MTCIAANLKEMAGDSLVSVGSIAYHTDKIFHIRDSLVGVAGDAALTTKFLAWFRKECPADEIGMTFEEGKEFAALVVNARGLFYYADCAEPDKLHDKHFAIGAGSDFALAAMDAGKSPGDAVRVACKRSPTTCGLPVKVLSLKEKARRGKKVAAAKSDGPPVVAQSDEAT